MTINHRGCPSSQQQQQPHGLYARSVAQHQPNFATGSMNSGPGNGVSRMASYSNYNVGGGVNIPPSPSMSHHHTMINPPPHHPHHHLQNIPPQLNQYNMHQTNQGFGGGGMIGGNQIQQTGSPTDNSGGVICAAKNASGVHGSNNNNNNSTMINSNISNNNNNNGGGCKAKHEYSMVSTTTSSNSNNNNVIQQSVSGSNGSSVNGNCNGNGAPLRNAGFAPGANNDFKYQCGGGGGSSNNNSGSVESNNQHNGFSHIGHHHHHQQHVNQIPSCYRQNFQEASSFSLEETTAGSTSSSSFPESGDVKPDLNGIELPHSTFKSEVSEYLFFAEGMRVTKPFSFQQFCLSTYFHICGRK